MKRREFIQKAAIAAAATPFAAWALWRGNSQCVGATCEVPTNPHDALADVEANLKDYFFPEKYLFDGPPPMFDETKPLPEGGFMFDDLDRQTAWLKHHFELRAKWLEFDYGEWKKGKNRITVDKSIGDTRLHLNRADLFVTPGAIIIPFVGDELHIHQKSGSGRDLDWRFKPAFRNVMGVDQQKAITGEPLIYKFKIEPNRHGEGLAVWGELEDIMWKRQIECCVIDAYPDVKRAREFQRKFPKHVFLCEYKNTEREGLATCVLNTDLNSMVTRAERNHWYKGCHHTAYMNMATRLAEDHFEVG